jgi:hypothetical protein
VASSPNFESIVGKWNDMTIELRILVTGLGIRECQSIYKHMGIFPGVIASNCGNCETEAEAQTENWENEDTISQGRV